MPGLSTSSWLVSTTSPVTGEKVSLAAYAGQETRVTTQAFEEAQHTAGGRSTFTDSMTPKVSPCSTSVPTSGSST